MTSNQPDRLDITDRRTYFAPPGTDTPDTAHHGAGQDAPRSAIGPRRRKTDPYQPAALADTALAEIEADADEICPGCGADPDFNQIHWHRCPYLEAK